MLTVHYNASVLYSVQYNLNDVIQYKLYRPRRAQNTCTLAPLYTCTLVLLITCTLVHFYMCTLLHSCTCIPVQLLVMYAISRLLYWNWETK